MIFTPYPSSAKTLSTVEPVAEACSCRKSTIFLVPVEAPVDSTLRAEPVVNAELWIRLDAVASHHRINWQWVKGHAGHVDNERADALANRGLELKLSEI